MIDKYEHFLQRTEAIDYDLDEDLEFIEKYLKENK